MAGRKSSETQPLKWQTYRTRFLVRAVQLTGAMTFVDALGREHGGCKGDYLVESIAGMRCIAPRKVFEDVYVAIKPDPQRKRTAHSREEAQIETKMTPTGKKQAQPAAVRGSAVRKTG